MRSLLYVKLDLVFCVAIFLLSYLLPLVLRRPIFAQSYHMNWVTLSVGQSVSLDCSVLVLLMSVLFCFSLGILCK